MNIIRVIHRLILYGKLLQEWPCSLDKWSDSPDMGYQYSEIARLRKMGFVIGDSHDNSGDFPLDNMGFRTCFFTPVDTHVFC